MNNETKQGAELIFCGDKPLTVNDVARVLQEFVRTMIMGNHKLYSSVHDFTKDMHDSDEVKKFFYKVATYVIAGRFTREDMVKDWEGDERKLKISDAGDKVVKYLGLEEWVYTDILSGRCEYDGRGSLIPKPYVPLDKIAPPLPTQPEKESNK